MSSIISTKLPEVDTAVPRIGWVSSRTLVPLVLFTAAVGAFVSTRQYLLMNAEPLDVSRAQAIAFPIFALFLYFVARIVAPVKGIVLAAVTALGVFGIAYAYNYHLFAGSSFVVATLGDDSFASETRIFKKVIEAESKRTGGVSVTPFYTGLHTAAGAQEILQDDDRTKGVVWGTRRWLNVTLSESVQSRRLQDFSAVWVGEYGGLKIVEKVPWIGLSYKPIRQTAEFLSAVFHGSTEMLQFAAQMQAPWTSYAHRGLAYLYLGNQQLKTALGGQRYNFAAMDCAIASYQAGWALVQTGDNPELKAALLNNLAVGTYLQGVYEDQKQLRKKGRKDLALAIRQPKVGKGSKQKKFDSPKVAWENFQFFRVHQNQNKKK